MGGEVSLRRGRNLGDLAVQQGPGLLWKARNFFGGHYRGLAHTLATDLSGRLLGHMHMQSELVGRVLRPNLAELAPEQIAKLRRLLADNVDVRRLASPFHADVVDYGTLSLRVVTTTGVTYLANNFAASGQLIANFKFHGFGSGTGAEAVGDTTLGTEYTTEYASDSIRPTGSQASAAGVYTTVGTFSPDSGGTLSVTEHGIFSASASGTLWDRSKFSVVSLVAGNDSLQVTYNLTCTAGG